jgi:hypothetical protein
MKEIPTDKLKGITYYCGCSEDTKQVKWFWNVFDRMSDEDRTLYLKFAWGRSRLPFDLKDCMQHTLYLCSYANEEDLPSSHTCSF